MNRCACLLAVVVAGCSAPSAEQLARQQRHFAERTRSAAVPLAAKARHFEARVPLRGHLVAQHPVFDNTCQYLAAMAAKRARQPSPELDRRIGLTIRALAGLPDAGIGTNEFSQLFFAYSLMPDHPDVRWHARILNDRFFRLHRGALPAEFSVLRPSRFQLSRSRILDALVTAEALAALTGSPESKRLLADCLDAGYLRRITRLELDLGVAKIPTSSTDWLNMVRLATLCRFRPAPDYRRALEAHFRAHADEDNALFEALHQLVTGRPSRALRILEDYPLVTDDREVFHRPARCQLIKNRWHPLTSAPIPLAQRGFGPNIWKRNPFKARENPGRQPTTRYHGLDFLLAYHLARMPLAPHPGSADGPGVAPR